MYKITVFFLAIAFIIPAAAQDILGPDMMKNYFMEDVEEAASARSWELDFMEGPNELFIYQQQRQDFFKKKLGEFPTRTPLNTRVMGTMDRGDYTIEKILYQSRPGIYVTALFYRPKTQPPFPAVLVPCGHSANGKANESYQRGSILLAKNGIAALCYDPIGQGERHQILKEDGTPALGSSTIEHTFSDVAATLVGQDVARDRIWDGIRGIDYLQGRSDVAPNRIGCAGNSGGGTLTAYLMALDDRIKVASPSCYITTFPKLIETIGPQDGEQCVHGQLAFGLDQPDYLIMRAPKPTLICAATQDFFDIEGTREAFDQAKAAYELTGKPGNVAMVEANEKHGWTKPLREGMAAFMKKHLLGVDEQVVEEDTEILTDEQARVIPGGEVLLLPKAKSIFDYYRAEAEALAQQREAFQAESSDDELKDAIRDKAGIPALEAIPALEILSETVVQTDRARRYEIMAQPEPGIILPITIWAPKEPTKEVVLALSDMGRIHHASPTHIDNAIEQGYALVLVDLPGIGRSESNYGNKTWNESFGADWQDVTLAYLLGRNYVGMRATHILAVAQWLHSGECGAAAESPEITVKAVRELIKPALHALALETQLFDGATWVGKGPNWETVLENPLTKNQLVNAIYGVLDTYTEADLERLAKEGGVTL